MSHRKSRGRRRDCLPSSPSFHFLRTVKKSASALGCAANRYIEVVEDIIDGITDGGSVGAGKKQRHGVVCTVIRHNQRAGVARFGDVTELNLFAETCNFSAAIA